MKRSLRPRPVGDLAHLSPEVIERDLHQGVDWSDPWCPELATGTCIACGQPARPEMLACDACADGANAWRVVPKIRSAKKAHAQMAAKRGQRGLEGS